ncbi:MAG: DUF2200 domain-containing protein [Canibacter sp.]
MTHKIFSMRFADLYPAYVAKVERKDHTEEELQTVIEWLTGYSPELLQQVLEGDDDVRAFFAQAPAWNPNAALITGVICGHRVEEIEDPLMQQVRYLDKLVDEVARGKKMTSILREPK